MWFPNSYFENEVREGFFVASMTKRAWAAQLEILEDIDRICQEHCISYFADCGTLLGAVRHGGFIPWDDDLDICMKRQDYNRFIAIAEKELPEGYSLLNFRTDDEYYETFARVVNSRCISFDKAFLEKFHGCPYIMGIDVFPMDYIARKPEESALQLELIRMITDTINIAISGGVSQGVLEMQIRKIEEVCNASIDRQRPLKKQLYLLRERIFSLYTEDESEEITLMPLWTENEEYKCPKAYYQEVIMLPFENIKVPVPAMYDAVLKKKYGEFMEQVRDGGVHDYPFYRGQERVLQEKFGINPYKYVFSEEDLQNNNSSYPEKISKRKQIREFLRLLEQNHSRIKEDIGNKNVETILDMLVQCQDTAIKLGTSIEEVKGEETFSVGRLEEYCEQVYQMYEEIAQGKKEALNKRYLTLEQLLEQVKNHIKEEVDLRYEAVFLPCKASAWDFLESVWKAAEEDVDCKVYVIPIPYFYKNTDGSTGQMYHEIDKYPDYVSITRYDTFDFEAHQPEMIYIQNPYDEYDSAASVHPFFYSRNLKKYTEQLIYIPSFVVDEIKPDDLRAIENIKYCCDVPGVIYADKVIVQSEGMRRLYIDILTEFAGAKTRKRWEEKIVGLGSPKMDKDFGVRKEDMEWPEAWLKVIRKSDGSWKKIVLYSTGVSTLVQYGEQMLEKLLSVFTVFKEKQNEVALLWMPCECRSEIGADHSWLCEKYWKLQQQYIAEGWGICDTSADIERAVKLCDAYYGDGNSIAQLCIEKKIPVMLQNVGRL